MRGIRSRRARPNRGAEFRTELTVIVTGIFDESWLIEIEAVAAA